MSGETYSRGKKGVYASLFLASLLMGIIPAQAELTVGRRYDQTSYQEIQELLFPTLLNWAKRGR